MQIKKGPYGYYALEKFDDPDSLCTYAEEVIAGNSSDFYLKPSTEYFGSGIMCSVWMRRYTVCHRSTYDEEYDLEYDCGHGKADIKIVFEELVDFFFRHE